MEIIRVANGDYGRYEDLLLYRDSLSREAELYLIAYINEFGELINKVFEAEIECIRLKKSIAYVQAAINSGGFVNREELDEYLNNVMSDYYRQLEDMINQQKACKKSHTVSEYDILKIKKIYRRIAKQIHPDICPVIQQHPEFAELWNRVQIAYNHNDLKNLEELEFLINKALEDAGIDSVDVLIPDIDEKIKEVEAEIEKIRTTDPYLYRDLLNDDDAVKEKKRELKEKLEEYQNYKIELQTYLDTIID